MAIDEKANLPGRRLVNRHSCFGKILSIFERRLLSFQALNFHKIK
jgi:hypothetical protein